MNPSLARRLHAAVTDVRALGWGAPVRAGYEASKRLGVHAAVFRRVDADAVPRLRSGVFPIFEVPAEVGDRTLAAADRVVSGEIELFGRRLTLGAPPDWHAVIHQNGRWPERPWWRLDLRSEDRPGDVKWVWELGRHRHLVLLARAVHLDPGDDRYRAALQGQLDSWVQANPPERGVHWYSNLEIAVRSLAWLQILDLAGEALDAGTRQAMAFHLYQGGRHLVRDLPYTLSTMRNNHLLGDALGLVALGTAFEGSTAARWARIGDELFTRQAVRMVRPDGSMTEDSLSYHRFVLEMLAARVLLGGAPAEVEHALVDAAQFLARLGTLEGFVPQYGDWDEGRVFAVAEHPEAVVGSVLLALALAGHGAPAQWRSEHDEVAWHVGEGAPAEPEPAETEGADIGGGMARAVRGEFTVWLKAGSGPSHGHADLLSVAIAHTGRWLTGDPGTGAYNGSPAERNDLRSSRAHNVVRVEGRDQREPHRVFHWRYRANGRIGNPVVLDGGSVLMWGCHDAYRRLDPPRRVVRAMAVSGEGVSIRDWVEEEPTRLTGSVQLPPDAVWDRAASAIVVGGERFAFRGPGSLGEREGWWSETYGRRLAAAQLEWEVPAADGDAWSIGEGPADLLEDVTVDFREGYVRLTVSGAPRAVVGC